MKCVVSVPNGWELAADASSYSIVYTAAAKPYSDATSQRCAVKFERITRSMPILILESLQPFYLAVSL